METKEALLRLLEQNRGAFLSGEDVARALGVSRAAVWKAVKALRAQGLRLESLPGKGYCLAQQSDWMSEASLRHYMADASPVRFCPEVDSTNRAGKQWAIEGAPHGALLLAECQTAGRGRLGRGFESPPGGLYMSVILRPRAGDSSVVLITAAAAVAVCRAVSRLCGRELFIKWVNDLFYQGKKCCGILTEAGTSVETGSIEYMVVGIGVNYTTAPALLGPAADVATSLFPDAHAPVPRAQLAAAIHQNLLDAFNSLQSREFLSEYRQRNLAIGGMVTVLDNNPYNAMAIGIDDDAHLLVRREDGKVAPLVYGEISIQLN